MRVGTVVAGRYRVDRFVGAGGMGEVWAAQDTLLGRPVALKLMQDDGPSDRARFLREAQAAAGLQHPGIVVVHDFGEHDGQPYLVMELLAGHSLQDGLLDGPFPVSRVIELGVQVAEALAVAHRAGLVHRDIKPGNLFLTDEGTVKILDFGLVGRPPAADPGTGRPVELTAAMGTPGFSAPEQFSGSRVDARADLYALGTTLYALLTGLRPVVRGQRPALRALRPDAPPELEQLLRGLLAPRPADRPDDAAAVAARLHGIAGHANEADRDRVRAHLTRRAALALGTAFAVLAAAYVGMSWLGEGEDAKAVAGASAPPRPTAPPRLAVGQCVNYTGTAPVTDADLDRHLGWSVVDCSQPHQGQVRRVDELPRTTNAGSWVAAVARTGTACAQQRQELDPQLPAHLGSTVLGPDKEGWSSGSEHYAYCTLRRLDGGPLTADLKP
ncbi:serine/threonine-protein kinase [Kitasatospora sp. NPDC059648]|uniref:serine/threonine-protein kinase n=1 Tax=Kitasatospora sp. NPDC059648 TaxID=3346894 RepID=UPI0036C6467D